MSRMERQREVLLSSFPQEMYVIFGYLLPDGKEYFLSKKYDKMLRVFAAENIPLDALEKKIRTNKFQHELNGQDFDIVERGFLSNLSALRARAVKMAKILPPERHCSLLEKAMLDGSSEVRFAIFLSPFPYDFFKENYRCELLEKLLKDPVAKIRQRALFVFRNFFPDRLATSLLEFLSDKDASVRREAGLALEDQDASLQKVTAERVFSFEEVYLRLEITKKIPCLKPEVLQPLLILALRDIDPRVRGFAVAILFDSSFRCEGKDSMRQEVCARIEREVSSSDPGIRADAILAARAFPDIVQRGMNDVVPGVRKAVIECLSCIDIKKRGEILLRFIKEDPDKNVRSAALQELQREDVLPDDLTNTLTGVTDFELWRVVICIAKKRGNFDEKFFNLAVSRGFGKMLIESNLYLHEDSFSEEMSFLRKDFKKTGFPLKILGKKMGNQIIFRELPAQKFLAWQRAFEAHELWMSAGFDYVPIEPIHHYKLHASGMVEVYCGVLDCDLFSWLAMTGGKMFKDQLDQAKRSLKTTLDQMGIIYTDFQDWNICLRFYRDDQGNPDFGRVPRLYLIDFDHASLLKKESI